LYAQATCRASIYRGYSKDEGGDDIPNNGPTGRVASRVIARIEESDSRVWDRVTQTPRVVRFVEGIVGSNVDVQIGDRVVDDTNRVWYVVDNVTQNRAPGRTPDKKLALKLVG